jgi:DNA-binding response OmpR family regulator
MLGKQLELGHYRAEFLQSYGIHVIFPENKNAAVQALRKSKYDAIILSYTLDPPTLKQLLGLIEEHCPDCPLISISNDRWGGREVKVAETVLDSDPPEALLEAIKRVQVRLLEQENAPKKIHRLK